MRDLEDRLRNWGAWSRCSFAPANVSPLYIIMKQHGAIRPGSGSARSLDSKDALFVEKAIINAALDQYETDILKGRYIQNLPDKVLCLKVRIRFRYLDDYLTQIKRKVTLSITALDETENRRILSFNKLINGSP